MTFVFDDFLAATRARDRSEVNRVARGLIDRTAPLGERWVAVSSALAHNGEWLLAIRAAELSVLQSGDDPRSRFALASALLRAGHPKAASAVALPLLSATATDRGMISHFLGVCALQLGVFADAQSRFRAALRARPDSGPTWLSLASLPAVDAAGLLDELGLIERAGMRADENFAAFLFAKGTLLDRLGETDDAFAAFSHGASVAATRRYDRTADHAEAIALLRFEPGAAWGAPNDAIDRASSSIFVSGLPRSGTTLIEQILANSAAVSGGSETEIATVVLGEVGGVTPEAMTTFRSQGKSFGDIGRLYRALARQRLGTGVTVDKSLNLSRLAAIYAVSLPDAPMVWLDRDILDVAWSNFRTWFARGAEWSLSLDDMAHHVVLEERLAAHWADVLDGRFRRFAYRDVVTETTTVVPEIAAHCGLSVEPAMLEPQQKARTVTSASFAQVRRPINRDGLGSAEPYRRHLQPFIDAYRAAGGTID